MKKRSIAILLTLLLILGLAACGSKSVSNDSMAYTSASNGTQSGYGFDADMPMEAPMSDGYWAEPESNEYAAQEDARSTLPDGVKMIYTANLELETTEFEKAASDVATLVSQAGGYFEQRSVRNYSSGYHSASYTVRIPAERFENFLNQIGDLCHVTYKTDSAQDITEQYYDADSRLKTAQIKLERLQELLGRADNMADVITIESAISDTEYQIEWLSGELRHYDALVGYSTIYITLNEVQRLTEVETEPPTFGQRFAGAFRTGLESFVEFLEDLALFLAEAWLPLLVLAGIVVLLVRLARRKKGLLTRKKKAAAPADTTDQGQQ